MHAMILAMALMTGTIGAPASGDVNASLATAIAPQLQTGALLLTQGDCLAIKASAGGPYTHVAAVVVRDGVPIVYDSMNGVGVRKLPLDKYLATQSPHPVELFCPRAQFTEEEAAAFEAALEQRLGTPYSVLHYVVGRRTSKGIHCSEYVTDALVTTERISAERPPRVSPSSLAKGLISSQMYTTEATVRFPLDPIPVESDDWCEQVWLDTKLCCARCCDKLSGWFLCK